MSNRTKVIISILALAAAFAGGRYLTPDKVVTVVKTVEVEKKTSEDDKNKHKETTVVEIVKPDGTKETTTKTVEDTNSKKSSTDDTIKQAESSQTIVKSGSRLSIAALGGLSLSNLASTPIYGGSISRELIGPISIGVWGLSNGNAGISLGLSF